MSKKTKQTEQSVIASASAPQLPQTVTYVYPFADMATPYMQMVRGNADATPNAQNKNLSSSYRLPKPRPEPLHLRADVSNDWAQSDTVANNNAFPSNDYWSMAAPMTMPQKPVKVKRTVFLVLVALFALLYVAVSVLSFLKVMPEYTSVYRVSFEDTENGIALEAIYEELGLQYCGLDDIVWSSLAKFFNFVPNKAEEESEEEAVVQADEGPDAEVDGEEGGEQEEVRPDKLYIYYDIVLTKLNDESPLAFKIACYAVPAAYLLSLIVAIYILIKAIISLFSKKRRKFAYASALLLLLSLLALIAMFVAIANVSELAIKDILNFLMMKVEEGGLAAITVSFGTYLLLGTALLTWVFSLFAYKSRKKAGDTVQKSKKKKRNK